MTQPLTSTKPYLLDAFYTWIVDNNCTPYIVVDASIENVEVPQEYIEEDRIVLNVSVNAVNNFEKTHDFISFEARFSGEVCSVFIPMGSIIAIYARENGRGMVFSDEDIDESQPPTSDPPKKPPTIPSGGKPKLTIVK